MKTMMMAGPGQPSPNHKLVSRAPCRREARVIVEPIRHAGHLSLPAVTNQFEVIQIHLTFDSRQPYCPHLYCDNRIESSPSTASHGPSTVTPMADTKAHHPAQSGGHGRRHLMLGSSSVARPPHVLDRVPVTKECQGEGHPKPYPQ